MKTMKIAGFALAVALAAFLAAACGGGDDDDTAYGDDDNADDDDDSGGPFVEVTIAGSDMNPDPVTISVGETVRWTNEDGFSHTVTSGNPGDPDAGDLFDSPNLGNGDTFEVTFDEAGSYSYFCRIHSGTMNGFQVIVNP
jgi:plastocyanin